MGREWEKVMSSYAFLWHFSHMIAKAFDLNLYLDSCNSMPVSTSFRSV